ncbi:MAG: hypothetical protein ACK4NP_04415 [Parvularculaceae bacterium]
MAEIDVSADPVGGRDNHRVELGVRLVRVEDEVESDLFAPDLSPDSVGEEKIASVQAERVVKMRERPESFRFEPLKDRDNTIAGHVVLISCCGRNRFWAEVARWIIGQRGYFRISARHDGTPSISTFGGDLCIGLPGATGYTPIHASNFVSRASA